MTTTTTQCPKCNDRGVIHGEFKFGISFSQCDCQTPEYWLAQSNRTMAEIRAKIQQFKNGGDKGGEIQHAGR